MVGRHILIKRGITMKLSTGKVPFVLEFDNGAVETIYFNPSDPDLSVRMKDFQRLVDERIKALGDLEVNADGTAKDGSEAAETVRSIQNILSEEIDRAFNSKISDTVFKYCSPFAIVGGNYFVLQFLEGITPEIESRVREARLSTEKSMDKYLNKYGK